MLIQELDAAASQDVVLSYQKVKAAKQRLEDACFGGLFLASCSSSHLSPSSFCPLLISDNRPGTCMWRQNFEANILCDAAAG